MNWLNDNYSFVFLQGLGSSIRTEIKNRYDFPLLSKLDKKLSILPKEGRNQQLLSNSNDWIGSLILVNLVFMSGNKISFEGEAFKKYLKNIKELKLSYCDSIHLSLSLNNNHIINKEINTIVDNQILYVTNEYHLQDIVEPISDFFENKPLRDKLLLSFSCVDDTSISTKTIPFELIDEALTINRISLDDFYVIENILNDKLNLKKDRILPLLLSKGGEKTAIDYIKILKSKADAIDINTRQILSKLFEDVNLVNRIKEAAFSPISNTEFSYWVYENLEIDLEVWNLAIANYKDNSEKIINPDIDTQFSYNRLLL